MMAGRWKESRRVLRRYEGNEVVVGGLRCWQEKAEALKCSGF